MDISGVVDFMKEDLKKVDRQFEMNFRSQAFLIPAIGKHILGSGGKRIRPLLLLLTSRLCGYEGDRCIPLASIVEFVHTATLLHDDVVDGADLRRGEKSANVVWGNQASVLVGDFLFTKSFSLLVEDGDPRVLKVMGDATTSMAEGEVLQLMQTSDIEISADEYYQVVINKTAVLISAACEIGGLLGNVSSEALSALKTYGMEVGISFQLMDDCLDYVADSKEFGKVLGGDLIEGKITLPLIYCLQECSEDEKQIISDVVDKEDAQEPSDFEEILKLIQKYDSISRVREEARRRINSAKDVLKIFAPSTAREALESVADYVVDRGK